MKPSVGQRLLIIVAVSLVSGFILTKMLESVVTMLCNTSEIQLRLQEVQIKTAELQMQSDDLHRKDAEFELKVQASEAQAAKEAFDQTMRNKAFDGVREHVRQLELQNQILQRLLLERKDEPTPACPFDQPDDHSVLKPRVKSAGYRRSEKSNDSRSSGTALSCSTASANSSTWAQLGYQRDS